MSNLNWAGPWSSTNTYNVGDAVSYLGSSYVASAGNLNVIPSNNPATWNLLAAAGLVGPAGPAGVNGASGSGIPQGLNWRGVYSTLTAYNAYDCVSYSGSTYICTANGVLNKEPDANPAYWGVLCVAGSGGGGGSVSWGAITGTLSGQTDLQTALNAKANSSALATVATTGSYIDLASKPTIPTVPTNVSAFTNDAGYLTSASSVAAAEVTGLAASATTDATNATNITTGTLAAARVANLAESQVTNLTTDLAAKVATSTLTALTTGLVKVTTGTGTLSTAVAADIPQLAYTSLSGLPTIPAASSTTPVVDGTATVGSLSTYAKADHVHPTDTSRAAVSSLAASATTDTTNATNISSGTLAPARMAIFTSAANGLAPLSGGGTTNFLRADGAWTTPTGGGSVSTFSAGTLSPLFTTTVTNPTSTPALAFTLSSAAQNSIFAGPATGGAGAPTFQTAPTISAANMTNFPTFNQNTTGTAAGLSANIAESQVTNLTTDLAARALTSAIPVASSTTPAMDGTAAVGVGTTFARADHVHASDTTRVSTATTVNGHALSANVVVSASDLTTGTLPHAQLPALVSGDIPANAANTTGTAATITTTTLPNVTTVNGTAIPAGATLALASQIPANIPNIQITTATTSVPANSMSSVYTAAMTGLLATSTVVICPSSDISAVTGWNAGSLYFIAWPSAGQLNYYIVNPTSAAIVPGSVTWNVSGK